MNSMKRTLIVALPLLLGLGCDQAGDIENSERMLLVAAVADDGREVLVGTYDEEMQELQLAPTFIDELRAASGGASLELMNEEQGQLLTTIVEWSDPLEVDSALAIMVDEDGQRLLSGALVIRDEEWSVGRGDEVDDYSFRCELPHPAPEPWCDILPWACEEQQK